MSGLDIDHFNKCQPISPPCTYLVRQQHEDKSTDRFKRGHYLTTGILFLCCIFFPLSAKADIFDWLRKAPKPIDCQIRDRLCLLNRTLDIAVNNYNNREVEQNYFHHARNGAKLAFLFPPDQRDIVRARWETAGADEDFFETYDKNLAQMNTEASVTLDILADALEKQQSPDSRSFAVFAQSGFKIIFKKYPHEGFDLWKKHFRMLWNESFDAVTVGFEWMARNNIDALENYVNEFVLPKSNNFNPYSTLSMIAAEHCTRRDDIKSGERILTILENDKANWKPDQEMRAMDWSEMTSGILACRGEDAAKALIEPIIVQMNKDIAAVQSIQNDQERAFVSGVIRNALQIA